MSDYLAGLLTIPVGAALFAGLWFAGHGVWRGLERWWLSPADLTNIRGRAIHASCVMTARRVWAFKLPGARLLVFRSVVGGSDYRYGRYYGETADLQERAQNVLLDEFDPR